MFLFPTLILTEILVLVLAFKFIDYIFNNGSDNNDQSSFGGGGDLPTDPDDITPNEGPADPEVLNNFIDYTEAISDDLKIPEKTSRLI